MLAMLAVVTMMTFIPTTLGANVTMLSPCSPADATNTTSAMEEQVQLHTLDELEAMEIQLSTSPEGVLVVTSGSAGADSLFSLNNAFTSANVIGSDNVFIQTFSGNNTIMGNGNIIACSVVGSGTACHTRTTSLPPVCSGELISCHHPRRESVGQRQQRDWRAVGPQRRDYRLQPDRARHAGRR
jgi:hypothetical protein